MATSKGPDPSGLEAPARLAQRAADMRDGATWTPLQQLKNDLIYAAVWVALGVILRLPRQVVAGLCRALGAIAYRVLRRERAIAAARLAAGLGARASGAPTHVEEARESGAPTHVEEARESESGAPTDAARAPDAVRRVRAAFLTLAATLADTLALFDPRERAGRTLTIDPASREVFRAALAEGRGVVFVSAHLGSWERMAALLVEEGFPVATVARESYDPRLTRLYERIRAPRGVRSIYRGRPGATAAIVRELRAGRAVGFLIDLPARVQSEQIHLFGALTSLPVGAARIALARRAAVVVGTPVQKGPPPEVLIERVPLDDLSANPDGQRALMTRLAKALELRIAAWPEAWLGLYAPGRAADQARLPHRRLRRTRDPR
jgi:Kdo2-lipid IVA lauroyltransferase/acyltransferase